MIPTIRREKININTISPKLLTCYLVNLKDIGEKSRPRYIYDYEIEFIIKGGGKMCINDTIFDIPDNSIVFRKPGDYAYTIFPIHCYLIAIDLNDNTCKDSNTYDIHNNQEFQINYDSEFLSSIPYLLKCSNPKIFEYFFSNILDLFIKNDDYSEMLIKSYIIQILYALYDESKSLSKNNFKTLNSPYNIKLKKVLNHIENNLRDSLTLSELSNLIDLSPWHFQKIFTKYVGMSPNKYILKKKINLAKELLIHTDDTIDRISLKCGFKNTSYFSMTFKKNVTLTPSEFRNKIVQYY